MIKIFLSSIYYPVNHEDKKRFNEELTSFYNAIPRNVKLLAGQDVNSNINVWSKMFRDVIGQMVLIIETLKINTSYFYLIVLHLECY